MAEQLGYSDMMRVPSSEWNDKCDLCHADSEDSTEQILLCLCCPRVA